MLNGKKTIVVMPAYNAEKTLRRTLSEVPHEIVDEVILVDDGSSDRTAELSAGLGIHTVRHPARRGYGGCQKTCYAIALAHGAEIVIMVHPDYQYTPKLVTAMAAMIAYGVYDVVLGSRILAQSARAGGMPAYKYVANRFLTSVQNFLIGQKLSEYHTGLRAYTREVLEGLPLDRNSEDFVFDNQLLTQVHRFGYRIGELSCPTRYFAEASSISFRRSMRYGLGCLANCALFLLAKHGIHTAKFLERPPARPPADEAGRRKAG